MYFLQSFEVDIAHPEYLHDNQNDLLFLLNNNKPSESSVEKLMVTFHGKTRFIIYYLNLQQVIANGLIFKEVRRVLEFNQTPGFTIHINLNTEMRKKAENYSEKHIYKLMNNAVFGIYLFIFFNYLVINYNLIIHRENSGERS